MLAPFANASRISWQTGTATMALFAKKTFRKSDPRATWLYGQEKGGVREYNVRVEITER